MTRLTTILLILTFIFPAPLLRNMKYGNMGTMAYGGTFTGVIDTYPSPIKPK